MYGVERLKDRIPQQVFKIAKAKNLSIFKFLVYRNSTEKFVYRSKLFERKDPANLQKGVILKVLYYIKQRSRSIDSANRLLPEPYIHYHFCTFWTRVIILSRVHTAREFPLYE
jgi:hypothetical protein